MPLLRSVEANAVSQVGGCLRSDGKRWQLSTCPLMRNGAHTSATDKGNFLALSYRKVSSHRHRNPCCCPTSLPNGSPFPVKHHTIPRFKGQRLMIDTPRSGIRRLNAIFASQFLLQRRGCHLTFQRWEHLCMVCWPALRDLSHHGTVL